MLNEEITKQDLFKACESLFGSDIDVSVEFLKYLQLSGVKAAFRKKALETHPDRAIMLAGEAGMLERRFKEVNLAYQLLSGFLACPWKYHLEEDGSISARYVWRPKPAPKSAKSYSGKNNWNKSAEPKYNGRVPGRRLLFGQYLYYTGHISLATLIKAIVWQRLQRPSIGAIATDWDMIFTEDVLSILQRRHYGEKFGECALRCGYLSQYQLKLLLERQKTLQPQIGRYFLEQRIVSSAGLFKMVAEMKAHNRKFWSS